MLIMRKLLLLTVLALSCTSFPVAAQESTNSTRKVIEKTEPGYPALARRNGLTGTVKLRVVIGPDGRAKDVEVLGGNPVFVGNATDSVKKWKWATADRETTEVVELKFNSGT